MAKPLPLLPDKEKPPQSLGPLSSRSQVNNRTTSYLHWAAQTGDIISLHTTIEKAGDRAKELMEETDGGIYGDRPIHLAARSGHVIIIQELVKLGADINALNDCGDTPLIAAAAENQLKIVNFLIASGADVFVRGSQGRNVLHRACEQKTHNMTQEVLRVIGVKEKLIDSVDDNQNTCLHLAASAGNNDVVDMILTSCPSLVNKANSYAWTPLHLACYGGHRQVAKYLIDKGANSEAKGQHERSALHRAIEGDREHVVGLLLDSSSKPNELLEERETEIGGTALHLAAMFGSINCTSALLQRGAEANAKTTYSQFTPIQVASFYGHAEIIIILAQYGGEVEHKGPTGKTALHLAAQSGHHQCLDSLIKCGAYFESRDDIGNATPLHFACYFGRLECAKYLASAGADKSARDITSDTPLHYATLGNQPPLVSFLISRGADTSVKDSRIGRTPLHDAVTKDNYQCALILLERANLEAPDDENMATALHLACWFDRVMLADVFLGRRANTSARDRNGYSPIHWAAIRGTKDVIQVLIKHGANIQNKGGPHGRTALMMVSEWGHTDCVSVLIDNGAHLETMDDRKKSTALHLAVQFNRANVARLLIKAGCKLDSVDDNGNTPLHAVASYSESDKPIPGLDNISVSSASPAKEPERSFSPRSASSLSTQISCQGSMSQLAIIRLILKKKPELLDSLSAKWDRTPLMSAAMNGQMAAVDLLLQLGANASLKDKTGKTALRLAFENNHYDVVRVFVQKGITN